MLATVVHLFHVTTAPIVVTARMTLLSCIFFGKWMSFTAVECSYAIVTYCRTFCLWQWVPWSHTFEFFENDYTKIRLTSLQPHGKNIYLFQVDHPKLPGGMGWLDFGAKKLAISLKRSS